MVAEELLEGLEAELGSSAVSSCSRSFAMAAGKQAQFAGGSETSKELDLSIWEVAGSSVADSHLCCASHSMVSGYSLLDFPTAVILASSFADSLKIGSSPALASGSGKFPISITKQDSQSPCLVSCQGSCC